MGRAARALERARARRDTARESRTDHDSAWRDRSRETARHSTRFMARRRSASLVRDAAWGAARDARYARRRDHPEADGAPRWSAPRRALANGSHDRHRGVVAPGAAWALHARGTRTAARV